MAAVVAADEVVVGDLRVAVSGKTRLGRGSAHVKRDRLRIAERVGHSCGADNAGHRPGLHHPDRHLDRRIQRHHPAARLHHEHLSSEALAAQTLPERAEIARHDRPDIGIDRRRRSPLVLPVLA